MARYTQPADSRLIGYGLHKTSGMTGYTLPFGGRFEPVNQRVQLRGVSVGSLG
jgi:hypothetical protein